MVLVSNIPFSIQSILLIIMCEVLLQGYKMSPRPGLYDDICFFLLGGPFMTFKGTEGSKLNGQSTNFASIFLEGRSPKCMDQKQTMRRLCTGPCPTVDGSSQTKSFLLAQKITSDGPSIYMSIGSVISDSQGLKWHIQPHIRHHNDSSGLTCAFHHLSLTCTYGQSWLCSYKTLLYYGSKAMSSWDLHY